MAALQHHLWASCCTPEGTAWACQSCAATQHSCPSDAWCPAAVMRALQALSMLSRTHPQQVQGAVLDVALGHILTDLSSARPTGNSLGCTQVNIRCGDLQAT